MNQSTEIEQSAESVSEPVEIKSANTSISIIMEHTAPISSQQRQNRSCGGSPNNNNARTGPVEAASTTTIQEVEITLEQYKEIIFDFDEEEEDRLKAFMKWHEEPNDVIFEVTNKMSTMFLFSGSRMIKEFMIAIIHTEGVRDIIKIEFAKTICCQNETKENFDLLDQTIMLIESTPIVIIIECIILLMKSDDPQHIINSLEYFVAIINNPDHELYFRYRTILSLESRLDDSEYFITEALLQFLECKENTSTFRILASQALLQKYFSMEKLPNGDADDAEQIIEFKQIRDHVQHELLSITQDGELDVNVRADAADVLLNLGSGVFQDQARDIILLLGAIEGTVRNVYQDGQNIHTTEIEKSALDILERLDDVEKYLTYEKARAIIKETAHQIHGIVAEPNPTDLTSKPAGHKTSDSFDDLFSNNDKAGEGSVLSEEERMVTIALNRIQVDRQLYSKYAMSLKGILLRVITFCNKSEHKDELYKRLVEELIDMHNKCSSGFAFRLVNTLSGYCEHAIRISWADQIAGNLSGRLNAMIRAIDDEDYQSAVMTELCLNMDKSISDRRNFLHFFRKALPQIREEMWKDFEEDLTDTEFDLYLRRAVVKYEGHEWL